MTGIDDDCVWLRREIQRAPELAGQERRTAGLVAEQLRAAGLDVTTGVGGHGIVAVLDGGDGPVIGYRADLDAVPDEQGGAAHICGHDVHTAVGVGIARTLAQAAGARGKVVFYFQPAEENLEGARAMIADGALDRLVPDEVYALHCAPLPAGTFGIMPGTGLPGLDTGTVVTGEPERVAAAVEALSTVAYPQSPEEYERIVADLLTPGGPLATFVVTHAQVEDARRVRVWVRAWPPERYAEVRERIRALGGAADFPAPPFPAMVCDPGLSRSAVPHLGQVVESHAMFPFNGEDFALFLERVPGAMFYLGVGPEGIPHHPGFTPDESAIGAGIAAMTRLLRARQSA
ncbi:M20/M25/M40 family metallo-hydrolase [Dactylosporangium sp. AC04546]|uniref:M20 metallopeptidase family protein n=1 Tax=Dactylosporangium sp. AC04546 TaxID=2862460 RepID=UPI001EE10FE1|nr:M20/M25/M40 family metallo-hydrolase [Dactylosporangium sp. AC04546]WVK87712.1 M20/M25/M40 family metallo-hydrolase [Dactylosporangium sp. AC04546]